LVPQTAFVRFAVVALLALAAVASPVLAETARTGEARAPSPLTLVQPEALPFSDAELRQALLARLQPRAGGPGEPEMPRAEVDPAGAGAVTVHVGARSRVVAVGERSGAGAARVVALVIAELLSAEAEPAVATEAPTVTVTVVAPAAPSAAPPTIVAPAPPPRAAEWARHLCLTAGAGKGTGGEELWAGKLDVDLVLSPGSGPLRLAPSAGLTFMPTRSGGTTDEVSFVGFVARALGGARIGPIDVLAGPVVSAYSIGGAMQHAGVLFGAEVTALLTTPLSERWRLVVAGRVDAFADRVRVVFADSLGYATPRVAISLGLGVAWNWTS
jgi:hypothetical protein